MLKRAKSDPINTIWLFLGSLIVNTGISFIWPLTTIYIHNYLHESLTIAGVVLFLNSIFTMLGNALGGYLFDKWFPYQTILLGVSIATFSTLMLIFFHGWPAYVVWLLTLGIGNGIIVTGLNSTATLIKSKAPSYIFNILYFTQNLGLVFGSLMVGFILPFGIVYIFILAFMMFLFFNIVVLVKYRHLNQRPKDTNHMKISEENVTSNPHLKIIASLLFCVLVAWIAYEQWNSNISSYMLSLHMSVTLYSFLWTLNAILIVTLQPILTYFDSWLTDHINGRLYFGFTLFALAFLLLIGATHYARFLLAMALLTTGEVFAFPAVSTFINNFASEENKGKYQGIIQVVVSAGRALGPLIGALVIDFSSFLTLFIFCTGIVLISGVIFFFTNELSKRKKFRD
ncbi:MFS transporter [Lactobacillus sp. PV037]|uniref:MFS transporter n=1 Tax=Lactobacillus sp. PV037 TaxID=2594496 RepID=UPI00223EB4C4|nr:MFS transporter [Lactobacillus sp. PV037]QNQ84403.1 MFS transporter [Lactobacillus sp. PV037]